MVATSAICSQQEVLLPSKKEVIQEAKKQGISIPVLKVALFVGCVLTRVRMGDSLPAAVTKCALNLQ